MKVAEEILAYCSSCKMDLAHTVAAMKGDRAVRVECKTCKKEHAYKAPKGAKDPTKAKKRKAANEEKTVVAMEVEWQRKMDDTKTGPTKPYSSKNSFKLGDKIKHSEFGDGIVERIIHPNKMEIMFRHELKILIHAGS